MYRCIVNVLFCLRTKRKSLIHAKVSIRNLLIVVKVTNTMPCYNILICCCYYYKERKIDI